MGRRVDLIVLPHLLFGLAGRGGEPPRVVGGASALRVRRHVELPPYEPTRVAPLGAGGSTHRCSSSRWNSAKAGSVEAWGRSPDNPIGGWYGLKKGLRGRFGMYLPPLLEALGIA